MCQSSCLNHLNSALFDVFMPHNLFYGLSGAKP
jgi:hypothetical protein